MDGIITLNEHICAKILSDEDFVHYTKLLDSNYVKMHHPKVLSLNKYEKGNILLMEKKGIPLSECDNHIIQDAQSFVYEYLNELHENDLYHGDLVRMGGCGIHLDNVLYDERDDVYYIIDFNSQSSTELETEVKIKSKNYCKSVVNLKKKRKNTFSAINDESSYTGRILAFAD